MDCLALNQPELLKLRQEVRDFVEKEIQPFALEWENSHHFPVHLLEQLGQRGLLGLSLPVGVGGSGKEFWHEVVLSEELARCGALGFVFSTQVVNNLAGPLVASLGSERQKKTILKGALAGEFTLALAATEKACGSDVSAISTAAIPEGDGSLRVNGEKCYITNGSLAKYLITLVRVREERDVWSMGLLVIPAAAAGVTRRRLSTVGLKTGDIAAISFENCIVSADSFLGDSSKGFFFLSRALQRERLIVAITFNALAKHVLEKTTQFLMQRKRFGSPLAEKQVISHRLAELRTRLEASRHFGYAVCEAWIQRKPLDEEILMLKLLCSETCAEIISACSHLHGAEGFLRDHWLAHLSEDSRSFTIAAGTSEVMKNLLSVTHRATTGDTHHV